MRHQRLRVGLYVNDTKAALSRFARCCCAWNLAFTSMWRDELTDLKPGAVDVLLLHGGWHVIERTKGRKGRKWKPVPMARINGPVFFPCDPGTMVFNYGLEERLGAVLASGYGGRAVAISPHPARTEAPLSCA